MKSKICILLALVVLCAGQAMAASYNFDVLYFGGGSASLAGGSDDPNGINLLPADSFVWTITAQGSDFWRVVTGGGFFPLMAFLSTPTANRVGDFDLSLLNNGVEVFQTSETGAVNSFVHIGTNTINLATGLEFDQMVLNYVLTSSTFNDPNNPGNPLNGTPADTDLNGLLPIFGAPEENPFYTGIEYVAASVPEPATYAMLLSGLALLGFSGYRRKHD